MCAVRRPNGFSLVEILVATILVGLSITALVLASNSFTMANGAGADLSTAEFLVEQIRELTAMTPAADPDNPTHFGQETSGEAYNDVDDFDGGVFSPPISADMTVLNDFASFSQQVIVQKLNPSNLDEVVADTSTSPFLRVTVTIIQNNKQITTASWIRAKY
jgi:prepilin-type N-terminal cleavage/methylation domain-containing protein